MELAGEDGSKTLLESNSTTVFGRGSGISTIDHTVSRHHVSFWIKNSDDPDERVGFEVIGKNPIWVRSRDGGEVRGFRRGEKGELKVGDWVSIGGLNGCPVWFLLKRSELEGGDEEESEVGGFDEEDLEGECEIDVSSLDPVKGLVFMSLV